MKKRILCCWILCLFLFASAVPALGLDDDEYNGYAADTLTIKVGYFGGPYYEKKVFTLDELWNLPTVYADYTFIDNMPSVVIDHVAGVRLSDVMEAAGIDLNSIETFYFYTKDKTTGGYYTSYSKAELIDTPRYCYYSLPENFNEETGRGNESAAAVAEPVDTVLALADDWNRCIAGAVFGSDYTNLNTNTRFRLIFGQTDTSTRTANRSAKWIHEIEVQLGGAPTMTLDASVLEGEVGSVLRTEASIRADSAVLANEKVIWSSSDESVATVDAEGNITIHGEGSAVITASFAGATASLTVNGTGGAPAVTESPPPSEAPPENSQPLPAETSPAETSPVETNPAETNPEGQKPVSPAGTGKGTKPGAKTSGKQGSKGTAVPGSSTPPAVEPVEEVSVAAPLFQPVTLAESETGGVQNWREKDMSDTAEELGEIQLENSAVLPMGIASGILLAGSGGAYAAAFYANVGRKKKCTR